MTGKTLGRTAINVSSLGLGCVTFGREIDEATSFAIADHALDHGITLFDTANVYGAGASETILGRWIKDRKVREKVVVATKVGAPMGEPKRGGCGRQQIVQGLDDSLRRLQTDYVDLYMPHLWDPNVDPRETLEALSGEVRKGKVRALGCSNYAAWQVCRMLWLAEVHGLDRMEFVHPPYNLVLRGIEGELIPLCRDQTLGIISYSPLGAGFLTGKYRPGQPIPKGTRFDVIPGHQDIYFHDASFRTVEALTRKAADLGLALPVLALSWAMTNPAITSVLIGARTVEQIDQALAARQVTMTPDMRTELSQLSPPVVS